MMNTVPFGGGCSLGLPPVSIATTKTSKYAAVRNVNEFLAITVLGAVGTATSNPTIALLQATSAAGAGAVALNMEKIYYKKGAPTFTAANSDLYIMAATPTREVSVATWQCPVDLSELECVITVLVRPIDLTDGFTHVAMTIVGSAAKICSVHFTTIGKAYQGAAIIDNVS